MLYTFLGKLLYVENCENSRGGELRNLANWPAEFVKICCGKLRVSNIDYGKLYLACAGMWLVLQGYKEVTLLGQNVNSYRDTSTLSFPAAGPQPASSSSSSSSCGNLSVGFKSVYRPRSGGLRFAELLSRVADVNPQMRIRFTSPHPKDFPDDVNTALHWLSLYMCN